MLAMSLMIFVFIVSYFIPTTMPMVFIIVNAIAGLGFGMFNVIITSMFADTVECAEWKTGKRSESIVFPIVAFATKASTALGGSAVAFSLAFYKFVPNVALSPEILQDLEARRQGQPQAMSGMSPAVEPQLIGPA